MPQKKYPINTTWHQSFFNDELTYAPCKAARCKYRRSGHVYATSINDAKRRFTIIQRNHDSIQVQKITKLIEAWLLKSNEKITVGIYFILQKRNKTHAIISLHLPKTFTHEKTEIIKQFVTDKMPEKILTMLPDSWQVVESETSFLARGGSVDDPMLQLAIGVPLQSQMQEEAKEEVKSALPEEQPQEIVKTHSAKEMNSILDNFDPHRNCTSISAAIKTLKERGLANVTPAIIQGYLAKDLIYGHKHGKIWHLQNDSLKMIAALVQGNSSVAENPSQETDEALPTHEDKHVDKIEEKVLAIEEFSKVFDDFLQAKVPTTNEDNLAFDSHHHYSVADLIKDSLDKSMELHSEELSIHAVNTVKTSQATYNISMDAAKSLLQVSEHLLHLLAFKEIIPAVKVNDEWMFSSENITALIEARAKESINASTDNVVKAVTIEELAKKLKLTTAILIDLLNTEDIQMIEIDQS